MGNEKSESESLFNIPTRVSRRSFLKWSSVLGGVAALSGGGLPLKTLAKGKKGSEASLEDKIVWSSCNVNCGSRCALRLHIREGRIVQVTTDDTGSDEFGDHQVRACLRGRSIRRRVYNPDRLKYPMKRVGKRGSGEFKRISWDEAYDTIAGNLKRTIAKYGNEAIFINYGTGTLGSTIGKSWPHQSSPIARLMNLVGGYLNYYGTYSAAAIEDGLGYTYGGWATGNSPSDIENTRLVVFFGNNPAATRMSGAGVMYYLQQAKKRGSAKIIVIDPCYTDTSIGVGDEWIPIRPGTDAALVSALAYVLIKEDLVDQKFLDNYCVGYDEEHMPAGVPANNSYKSYILGLGSDGTEKTPAWASNITGIPAELIVRLAREIGQTKPAYIAQGWGPQRSATGEEISRAIAMLPILTGNVGINGGNSGARESSYSFPFANFPVIDNQVTTSIPCHSWTEAIVRGPRMTALRDGVRGKEKLNVPIKFIWNYASNTLVNQHSNINRTVEILKDDSLCETIVVIDNHMTVSARYADIILPDVTNVEQSDFVVSENSGNMGYLIATTQAITPMFECRSIYEICSQIARRLGVEQKFTEGRSQEEWLRHIYSESRKKESSLPTLEKMRKIGIFKKKDPSGHYVAYRSFRQNPKATPLGTPSGKIEIFSQRLWDIAKSWELSEGDVISALPQYVPSWEGVSDPLRKRYPLQMMSVHYKQRTHSTYGNVEHLKEVAPQEVWLNSTDAKARKITQGDRVRVFNDRGSTILPAKVTERIMPGVVTVFQGAWFTPGEKGGDLGGSANVLTSSRPTPLSKGNTQHTNLVEIEKI